MKRLNYFTSSRDDPVEPDLNFTSFRASSPSSAFAKKDDFLGSSTFNFSAYAPKNIKEGLDSLFGSKPIVNPADEYDNFFGNPEKHYFEKENDDAFNFFVETPLNQDPFRKPVDRKESVKSANNSETASQSKDMMYATMKNETTKAYTTDVQIDGTAQKKYFHESLAIFQDLTPVEEVELPALNSMVSLSIAQGSSSLEITTCTCKLSNCKLLHNFLSLAEEAELADLQKTLSQCKSELSAKIAELKAM